jgi:hypothetical protein
MHPHAVTDHNPNDHYGVRACSFAGQLKSNDCGGRWFSVPTQHVRVANPLAPHVCVCANHLRTALEAVAPSEPKRTRRTPAKREEVSVSL